MKITGLTVAAAAGSLIEPYVAKTGAAGIVAIAVTLACLDMFDQSASRFGVPCSSLASVTCNEADTHFDRHPVRRGT